MSPKRLCLLSPSFLVVLGAILVVLGAIAIANEHEQLPAEAIKYQLHARDNLGDPANGKKLFFGEKLKCSLCHDVGTGVQYGGPDMLGIADKYQREKLIESVLQPSKEIVAGYATETFVMANGKAITGITKKKTETDIELWIEDGKTITVATDQIEEQSNRPVSLMPDGLFKLISKEDFSDLIAYLETLKNPNLYTHAISGAPETIESIAMPIRFEPIHHDDLRFNHPIWFQPVPGIESSFVVVENDPGKIWLLEKTADGMEKSLFLDHKEMIHTGQHMGLMGLAFHPDFAKNRKYYLNHHFMTDGQFGTHIVERLASEDSRTDSGKPSRLLLQIDQWTILHTGGMVAFGPDGYLYIGTGDGGPQTDPEGHAQSKELLLGAILRIDVDNRTSGLEYGIPSSNPFYGDKNPKVRQEIWATGLRQAWRFSWDPLNRDLWVGDVGQVRFEEITIVRKGENHGWNVYEGFLPFSDRYKNKSVDYVPPVAAIGRNHGVSVTGGYVYRGKRNDSFNGVYIFADYESKRVWGLTQKDRVMTKIREIGMAPDRVTTFSVDDDGELYILGYDHGMIHRVVLDESKFE